MSADPHEEPQFTQPSLSHPPGAISSSNEAIPADQNNSKAITNENIRYRMYPKIIDNYQDKAMLLTISEIIRNRWEIKGLIGSGGYGQIYMALDKQSNANVAVKAEPTKRRGKVVRRMILEQKVLVILQGRPHVPVIHGSGCEHATNFIVMQLLSVNVSDLRRQSPLNRLSKSTCARIAHQTISALRDLHNSNFIHRDIKAANLCFGISDVSKHRLFLVDYGLVRCYRSSDGTLKPKRKRAGFRGTMRYVSLRVHDRSEPGPSDDLISLFYTILELLRGELVWAKFHHQNQIRQAKEHLLKDDFQQISDYFGEQLREFGRNVYAMRYDDTPNYSALQDILNAFGNNTPLDSNYDWEDDYETVMQEEEINQKLNYAIAIRGEKKTLPSDNQYYWMGAFGIFIKMFMLLFLFVNIADSIDDFEILTPSKLPIRYRSRWTKGLTRKRRVRHRNEER